MTTADDYVAAYCLHTRPLLFGGVTYKPSAVEPARPVQKIGLQPNSIEIKGVFDDVVLRCDIEAGYWRGATIRYEVVNYLDLTMGSTMVVEGKVGKTTVLNSTAYQIEFVFKSDALQPLLGHMTAPIDRNSFPAGVNVASYTYSSLSISDVIDRTHFKVSYAQTVNNYFKWGIVRWAASNSFHTFTNTAFQGAVNRDANSGELSTWNTALLAGWDVDQASLRSAAATKLEALFVSAEYVALNTTDAEFVEDCYECYLGRASDAHGKYAWVQLIPTIGRAGVRAGLLYAWKVSGSTKAGRWK
jgi:hypothetical protein